MKRTCPWCKRTYNTKEGASSIWCDANPNRGRGAKRIKKRGRRFTMLMLPSTIRGSIR